jgi:siroheme synthase-like protein
LARIEHNFYAATLDLRRASVLVVGGGEVAVRKIGSLLAAGADVTVVAPEFHPAVRDYIRSAKGGAKLRLKRCAFKMSDLKKARLVFAATNDRALNEKVAAAARKAGLFVNVAAPGEAGSFHVPASVWRGSVGIAISTGGASAALARTLRKRVENFVGPEWGELAALLEKRRATVKSKVKDEQRRHDLLCELGAPKWAGLIRNKGRSFAAKKMDAMIEAAAKLNGSGKGGRA